MTTKRIRKKKSTYIEIVQVFWGLHIATSLLLDVYLSYRATMRILLKSGTPLLLLLRISFHFFRRSRNNHVLFLFYSCDQVIHPCDCVIHLCNRLFYSYDWAPHLSHISCSQYIDQFWSEYETPLLFSHVFESLNYYIHGMSIFSSEHRACHLVSHFSSFFCFAHRR